MRSFYQKRKRVSLFTNNFVESAIINPKKSTEYALNPSHPVGGNKSKLNLH